MGIFHANEFVVNLPDGLKDKTINAFSLTDDAPSDIAIVVTRERPQSGETIDRFADRSLAALLGRLPMLEVLKKEVIRVDNQPAISLDYTWMSPEGKMFQRHVMVYARLPNLMLIITATCRERMASRWESMFNDFLAGFRLRTS
jgi:hypothetical protein